MHHRRDAGCRSSADPLCKWEVGITCEHRAASAIASALQRNLNGNTSIHLRRANTERCGTARNDNGSCKRPCPARCALPVSHACNAAVVAAIPSSFLDLLDRCIAAAKGFQPLAEPGVAQLKQMAAGRGSVFVGEENQVALNSIHWRPVHPDSPHEA